VAAVFAGLDDLFCTLACACERKTDEWIHNAEYWDDGKAMKAFEESLDFFDDASKARAKLLEDALAQHMTDQASDDYSDSKERR